MSNFTDSLANAARSGACQLLGLPQYLNDMTTRLSGGLFTPPLSEIPNLWRRALCDRDAPPSNDPPFTGGQCPIFYDVTYNRTFTQISTGNQTNQNVEIAAPVLGPVSQRKSSTSTQDRLEVINGNGEVTNTFSVNNQTNENISLSIVSVTPTSGGSDDCGDPDPEYPPLEPEDVTIPRDVTYEDDDGVNITIPVIFGFALAQVSVDADIVIPFTLEITPTLNITGTVNVDGSVNFNFGGGNSTTQPKDPRKDDCGDVPTTTSPLPTDPTDSDPEPEPQPETEEVIRGVVVTVTSLSRERATLITQNDNPDIYAPSLGFVQFLCRVGTIAAAWTSDIPVKNRRNLIPCPWTDGAIAVRGTPQPGVTWTLTPVVGQAVQVVQYVE